MAAPPLPVHADETRHTLQESLGVTFSTEWWNACCAFLQGRVTADAVLSHLLVSDLRDVVRRGGGNGDGDGGDDGDGEDDLSSAARQLHQAIQQSTHSNSSKQQLPANFQLLCQMEEAVDMSLNTESRLARASGSGSGSQPPAQQQQYQQQPSRSSSNNHCLKLFLTDGYSHDPSSSPIVGMEVLPLMTTSWTPVAGCKLLIKGPLTIRWGILQLHSGNATIVGGSVPELVEKQAKALEQAQRMGGVGVDATIRALIGTNPMEDEETTNDDEGEGESGDVVAPAASAPAPVAPPPPPPPPHPHPQTAGFASANRNTGTSTTAMGTSSSRAMATTRRPLAEQARPNPPSTAATITPAGRGRVVPPLSTSTTTNPYSQQRTGGGGTTTPFYTANHRPITTAPGTSSSSSATETTNSARRTTTRATTTSSVSPPRSGQSARNPYATVTAVASNVSSTSAQSSLAVTTSRPSVGSSNNPYQQERSLGATNSSSNRMAPPSAPAMMMSSTTVAATANTGAAHNSISSSRPSAVPANPYSSSSLASNPPNSRPAATATATSSIQQRMSFRELRSLLTQLVHNRAMYESYYQQKKEFQVDLIQKGGKMHFNIGKDKVPGNKKKQYCFEIHATFGVPQEESSDHLLSCKLPSALIEPYFEKTPAELRVLIRSDRPTADQIVDTGGTRVKQAFFSYQTWTATLFPPPEQVFDGAGGQFEFQDVRNPILVMEPAATTHNTNNI